MANTLDILDRNAIKTKSELQKHMSSQMNPMILKNMEYVNYTMDGGAFEHGTNAKSTQGVPIQSFLRLNKIENERRMKQDSQKTWIRRNKHVIKLKSIMNRDKRSTQQSLLSSERIAQGSPEERLGANQRSQEMMSMGGSALSSQQLVNSSRQGEYIS